MDKVVTQNGAELPEIDPTKTHVGESRGINYVIPLFSLLTIDKNLV